MFVDSEGEGVKNWPWDNGKTKELECSCLSPGSVFNVLNIE